MIYLKRILWLLGYPIMWLLVCALFIVAFAFIGFECLYFYIKNGNKQDCYDCLEWCINLIEWYEGVEPKESEL